jgi:hypothetical protein
LGEKLLAALSPRRLFTARSFIAAVAAGVASAGVPMHRALTFQPSNHSFIQLFEMQPPQFARIA